VVQQQASGLQTRLHLQHRQKRLSEHSLKAFDGLQGLLARGKAGSKLQQVLRDVVCIRHGIQI
jgi:hypothetical protein